MTREEAEAIYDAGREVVVQTLLNFSMIIEPLQQRIKELEDKVAQLSKDSTNSSKPPSSDITKPKRKKKQKNKGKKGKIGAQPWHPKHERSSFPIEEIDVFQDYILKRCPECDGEVNLIDDKPRIKQQVELDEIVLTRTEHRSYPVWCENCQKIHYMELPPEVVKAGLFKERITALVAYMKNCCHASFSTIRKFIRDVLKEKISRGHLRKLIEKVSNSLELPYKELLDLLPHEDIVNVDETGHKENGNKFWTWVFKADLYIFWIFDIRSIEISKIRGKNNHRGKNKVGGVTEKLKRWRKTTTQTLKIFFLKVGYGL